MSHISVTLLRLTRLEMSSIGLEIIATCHRVYIVMCEVIGNTNRAMFPRIARIRYSLLDVEEGIERMCIIRVLVYVSF